MPLLLNTPVAANIQGYAPLGITFDLQALLVSVQYAPIVGGAIQYQSMQNTPQIATTVFEALAGATNRLKALQAVANALGLSSGAIVIT